MFYNISDLKWGAASALTAKAQSLLVLESVLTDTGQQQDAKIASWSHLFFNLLKVKL